MFKKACTPHNRANASRGLSDFCRRAEASSIKKSGLYRRNRNTVLITFSRIVHNKMGARNATTATTSWSTSSVKF
jgi:hypothetical protein